MNARLVATLLAALALTGCASTSTNYASKGVLLDDGSYYFPARDGQGDYYYAQPARISHGEFHFSFGYGAFSGMHGGYCGLSSWHCSPWSNWYGFDRDWRFGSHWAWQYGNDPWWRDPRHGRDRDGHSPRPRRGRLVTDAETTSGSQASLPGAASVETRHYPDRPHRGDRRPYRGDDESAPPVAPGEFPGMPALVEREDDSLAPRMRRSHRRDIAPMPPATDRREMRTLAPRQRDSSARDRQTPVSEPTRIRNRESGHDEDGQ